MRKNFLLAMAAALVVATAAPASADTVLFNPEGDAGGTYIPITGFDWAPGNGIVVGANAESDEDAAFDFYYQASLSESGICQNEDGPTCGPTGDGPYYFTVVLGISETISSITTDPITGVQTFNFALDSGANTINFFQIYATTVDPSNTSGSCFACGILVLEGDILPDLYQSSFSTLGAADPGNVDLDSAGAGNDYPGVFTIAGSGQTDLRIGVTYVNSNFLLGAAGSTIVFGLANSVGAGIPYDFANPSACFMMTAGGAVPVGTIGAGTGTFAAGNQCPTGFEGVASVGAINGLGENIMLEVDGNVTFETAQLEVVPEPATLGLLGLGLLGAVAVGRRAQRRK